MWPHPTRTASRRRPAHAAAASVSHRAQLLATVVGAVVGMAILSGGAAFGYWVVTDHSNPAQASADSLPQGQTPNTPTTNLPNGNTVTVTFARSQTTSGHMAITSYNLTRYPVPSGSAVSVTASCSGTSTITCVETNVPDGRWQYTDTATMGTNWVGSESAHSGIVTVDTTPPAASVTYPVTAAIYGTNWSGTVTGSASDATSGVAGVGVAVKNTTTAKWWNGTSFSASSQTFVSATGTTSWSLALASSNLVTGDAYTVVAQATDSAGNVGTSATVNFTYNTAAPTVSVSFPVNNTTYGANWSGSVTGSASSNAGSGTSVSSVGIAVKNTTTSKWWNGTSFSATSQTFVSATGTTSWSLALASSNLVTGDAYAVVAQATDSAGNVGVSSTVNFTYNTAAPTVSVSFPVNNTTYGANWSGSVTGSASSNAGSGTSVASVGIAVKNTTTAKWWNGTSFSATSQTFVSATGTTSWSLALASINLVTGDAYTVVAQATDSAGNVGTSATVNFTYNAVVSMTSLVTANGSGGTVGKLDANDTIALTFSGQINASTVCSAWTNGLTTTQSTSAGSVVTITNSGSGDNILSFTTAPTACGTFNVGSIDLGSSSYVTSSGNSHKSVTFTNSTISYNGTSHLLTITLGTAGGGGTANVVTSSALTVSLSTSVLDTGNAALSGYHLPRRTSSNSDPRRNSQRRLITSRPIPNSSSPSPRPASCPRPHARHPASLTCLGHGRRSHLRGSSLPHLGDQMATPVAIPRPALSCEPPLLRVPT